VVAKTNVVVKTNVVAQKTNVVALKTNVVAQKKKSLYAPPPLFPLPLPPSLTAFGARPFLVISHQK
jgi:hypothetical protein